MLCYITLKQKKKFHDFFCNLAIFLQNLKKKKSWGFLTRKLINFKKCNLLLISYFWLLGLAIQSQSESYRLRFEASQIFINLDQLWLVAICPVKTQTVHFNKSLISRNYCIAINSKRILTFRLWSGVLKYQIFEILKHFQTTWPFH